MTIPVEPGQAVAIAPGVRRYTAPNPGVMTGPGTNSYLIGNERVTLVDPGPDMPGHAAALLDLVGAQLERIVLTHTHRDHSPAARALADATGVPICGMPAPPTPENDTSCPPDIVVADGMTFDCDGLILEILHTPGHASNHVCPWLPANGMLLTGDHIMQGSTVVIAAPDGDMAAYLESLARLRRLPIRCIAPGHGTVIESPHASIDAIVAHRLAREHKVRVAVASAGPAGTDALLPLVYDDVDPAVWPIARYSLLAHLLKLAADGVIAGDDAAWQSTEDTQ